jgi:hypothetical protein
VDLTRRGPLGGGRRRAPARRSPGRATTARDRDPSTRPGPRCSRHPGCPGSWVDVPSPRYRPSMGCDRRCSRGAGPAAPGSPTPRYQLWRPDTRTGATPPPGGA